MDSDEVYKFIGYAVAVIFFIYLISKSIKLNVRVIEGMTSSNDSNNSKDSKKGIKDNKLDDEGKDKSNEDNQKIIDSKEKQNESHKKDTLLARKETIKDILSATYNHSLNIIIMNSYIIGQMDDFSKLDLPKEKMLDNMNKLKTMKDYLDIVEFAYNQLDEMK